MLYKDSAGGLQTEHWYNIVKEFELEFLDYRNSKIYEFIKYSSDMVNILRWQSHPIFWNRAMESVIESQSSDGGSHDLCRGSQ